MEPLTAIGAVASAAQLFDMSLNYSNRACKFISAFNKAAEHAALLQQKLQEVNLLMRELQRYIDRCSQLSVTDASQHPPLLHSIVEVSRQFADDMICLHSLLPYDITAFSASIRKRARFVLKEKDAENVVRRLEGCKSAAIVALELIGRLNDESAGRHLTTLQQQVRRISNQQNDLAQRITRSHEKISVQSHLQDSRLMTPIREVHELVVRNDAEAADCLRIFADNTARGLSEIQTQVAKILAHQNSIMSTQRLQIASANAAVNDADILARLIRLELRQQLEPLLDKMDGARDHIDRIAAAFSSNAISEGLFKTEKTSLAHEAGDDTQAEIPRVPSTQREAMVDATYVPSMLRSPTTLKNRKICQSSVTYRLSTRVGELCIRLRIYRQRKPGTDSRGTYFQLRADIIPQPWLCSRGLSTTYSSGPNHQGYYDICPSISIINVREYQSEFAGLMRDDDPKRFRLILETGRIGIWDTDEDGFNLLQLSIMMAAPLICQFLLRDSGYGSELVEREGVTISTFSSVLASCIVHAEPNTAADILFHLKHFTSDSTDEYIDEDSLHLGWTSFYEELSKMDGYKRWNIGLSSARLLIDHGHVLRPYGWLNVDDMAQTVFLMEIYLSLGGSPNASAPGHPSILLFALNLIAHLCVENPKTQVSTVIANDDLQNYHEVEVRSGIDYQRWIQDRESSVKLLASLILAGASFTGVIFWDDLFNMDTDTMCSLASMLGIQDIWEDALKKCGLDPTAVFIRGNRYRAKERKLWYASRTGVDVENIVQYSNYPSLRLRNRPREVMEL